MKPEEQADLDQALGFSLHLPFDRDDWREAAQLERELRAKGLAIPRMTIPRNDLFVATVALPTGLPVACRDAHFEAIRRAVGARIQVEPL